MDHLSFVALGAHAAHIMHAAQPYAPIAATPQPATQTSTSSPVSWPTFFLNGALTIVVALLTIAFGESIKWWILRRLNRDDRTRDNQIAALDDYISKLRATATDCRAVGSFTPRITKLFGVANIANPGSNDVEELLRTALRSLQALASYVAGHALRLPSNLQSSAAALRTEISETAGIAMLALAEDHGVQTYHAVPEVAGFSTVLESAATQAEAVRAKTIGR